ncbi:hypothetical protein BDQ17DRAFT_1025130 [Cyathus striatus]|nr:hypothetical protein BDQ17DRAFT_1025130 [Cyathus striatus]
MALTLCTNVIASRMADAVLCAAEATTGVFGEVLAPLAEVLSFSPLYHFSSRGVLLAGLSAASVVACGETRYPGGGWCGRLTSTVANGSSFLGMS